MPHLAYRKTSDGTEMRVSFEDEHMPDEWLVVRIQPDPLLRSSNPGMFSTQVWSMNEPGVLDSTPHYADQLPDLDPFEQLASCFDMRGGADTDDQVDIWLDKQEILGEAANVLSSCDQTLLTMARTLCPLVRWQAYVEMATESDGTIARLIQQWPALAGMLFLTKGMTAHQRLRAGAGCDEVAEHLYRETFLPFTMNETKVPSEAEVIARWRAASPLARPDLLMSGEFERAEPRTTRTVREHRW